ncbi:MAG: hypothetical protein AABW84_02275 [Nanoarchaeota archaeon]
MNKRGTLPDWLIALILAIAIFLVIIIFILGPYKTGISNYLADNLFNKLGGS